MTTTRRAFLQTAAVSGTVLALAPALLAQAAPARRGIKLGLDNFSVRAMNWKADALIAYAAQLETDSLFITDLDALENFEPAYLTGLKKKAADSGLQIQLGTWSICPTSRAFKNKWGTAEEHLALGLKAAHDLGSSVLRVILGKGEDRETEGGINARIADTVKVLQSARTQAVDAGVKIAVENHAGDMRASELAGLVEAAGKDFVGVNLDSGNALWTLEDPLASLEILGPYALTTSLRDSAAWESDHGTTVQWTAMGEGQVDWKTYFNRFAELCPGVPVHIETISGFNREFAYLKPEFWKNWPQVGGADFARFLAFAKKGKARPAHKSANAEEEQAYQKGEIERSLAYCKKELGLGLR